MSDTVSPSRSRNWLSRWRGPLLIALGLAALWTGIVGAWLPGWLRPRVMAAASEALGTPVSMAEIHVRPWTGVLRIDALVVGPASAPLLKLRQAEAQLSLESIWRLAPVLRRITLTAPELWIERQSAQGFNFSPIVEKLMADREPARPDDEPQRFAVFNIVLQDGSVRYTDRVLAQSHVIDKLNIGVPFLSNLPSKVDVDVLPLISARIDGSPLQIKGRTLPFNEGLKSEINVQLDAVDVPHWIAALHPFLPAAWRPDARAGRLNTALTVGFESRKPPSVPLLSVKGRVSLDQLDLAWKQAPMLGEAALDWKSLKIEGIDAAPLERRIALGRVDLDGVRWHSGLDAVASASPPKLVGEVKGDAAPVAPWLWRLDELRVQTGRIDVQPLLAKAAPASGTAPRWPALGMVRVSAKGLDSKVSAAPANWQLALNDEHNATLLAHGTVQVARQQVDAQINLDKLQLARWLAPLTVPLGLPLTVEQGELALQAKLNARLMAASATEPAQASLLSGQIRLQGVDARASQRGLKDRVKLAGLTLDGVQARMDLGITPALREVNMDSLHVAQLDADITRGARGEWLGLASPPSGSPTQAASDPAAPVIVLKRLHCEACQARLTDQTVTPAARLDVSKMNLQVAGLSNDLAHAMDLELDTLAQGQGRLRFKGGVKPEPLSVQGRVQVSGLDLRAVQPYIDPWVNIRLAAAKAQLDGQLNLQDKGRAGLSARYKGRAGLSDLRVQDRINEADFVRWQTLSLDGLDVAWANQALEADLGRIALKDFYGRVIVNPSGELNLASILRQQAGGEAKSLTTPEPAAKGSSTSTSPASTPVSASASSTPAKPKLRWRHIQLAKGRIDFTDNFIKPNYSARLTQVEGEVSAVSSTQPEPATITVSGAVDDAAPLRITGQIHPLGPQLYTDIEGSAKGIELTRLTPYAARYAGYAIEKGSLSVTVHYKVDGGKLEASNQIFLDQLTFGDKTDSPDAVNLPVQLAVSLLKNGKGEIDVNLPISGSLDDPEFSVGGIIWRVVVNLITKAVTAPFSLLSDGGTDELGLVAFEPGSARLSDDATQRLDTLVTKLQDRPALKLEATGRADPAFDVEGLRRVHVNRLIRGAKARAAGEPLADVRVDDNERLTWLKAAYKEADIKKPRNVIGLAKTLSPDEMEALLAAAATVDDEALRSLANRRGDVVKAYLAAKLPPERVLLTASKIGAEGLPEDKSPTTRVQFSVK
jgi:hypothetical protein